MKVCELAVAERTAGTVVATGGVVVVVGGGVT